MRLNTHSPTDDSGLRLKPLEGGSVALWVYGEDMAVSIDLNGQESEWLLSELQVARAMRAQLACDMSR